MPEASLEQVAKPAAESTNAEPQKEAVVTPAESKPAQLSSEPKEKPQFEPSIPYPRFKEVNERAKNAEAELASLKQKLAGQSEALPLKEPSVPSSYAKRLTDGGLDPKASELLAEVMKQASKDTVEEQFASAEKALQARKESMAKSEAEISEWRSNFRKEHKDYAEYEADMQKEWEALDDGAKMALVASPKSFELLYKAVRSNRLEKAKEDGVEEGRSEAYQGKTLKSAISSTPGATAQPNKKFTAEDVKAMSKEQYSANRDQILSDLGLK